MVAGEKDTGSYLGVEWGAVREGKAGGLSTLYYLRENEVLFDLLSTPAGH